ncbi:MAG: bifunctional phosphoribosyl-AMP cyclohydrolase/phosphoribosyl-ATP diphosphatase HisIE [Oscillospiraceae bacterium]|nr:bifunctional phosphoribosyl-AMP cyclohydrolase/phosphoribosyl-ATP diphosphatase HisIE [Oscillospiraceae bacterium]
MFIDDIKFDEKGLVPAVVQDATDDRILMLAYMNRESLEKTLETGKTWFFSRSRGKLWNKGETSGHFQTVREILVDCDMDSLVIKVDQTGAACHTGNRSCFYRKAENGELAEYAEPANAHILDEVYAVVKDRMENPKEDSYTNYLLDTGIDKILKKVGEECSETIIAAKNDEPDEIALETSDLLYHLIVMLAERGMTMEQVYAELKGRR